MITKQSNLLMERTYKDLRSIDSWMKREIDSRINKEKVDFFTLDSLTPIKISEIIREHYIEQDDDKTPTCLKLHYAKHQQLIHKRDADDQRLISILLFVIDHILSARIYNRKSYDEVSGAVSVSTEVLRVFYDDGSYIRHVLEVARTCFILQMVTEYIYTKGEQKSRTYRVNVNHINKPDNPLVIVACPDVDIAKKVLTFRGTHAITHEILSAVKSDKVLLKSLYFVNRLQVNYDSAYKVLRHNLAKDIRRAQKIQFIKQDSEPVDPLDILKLRYLNGIISLRKIQSNNILDKHMKFDKSGRIHSNLTNFPKEIRHLLSFSGCDEPLALIDMANCQPFLLVNLIMEYLSIERAKKITTRAQLEKYCQKKGYSDVIHYVDVVENANFYKECHRLYVGNKRLKEITPTQKEKARKMIYTAVLFGDGSTKWDAALKLAQEFGKEYPTVLRAINHYRQGNPTNLSDKLQQEESHLFIDDILTKLIVREKRPYILSLHDGFLCPESAVPFVIDKFKRAFSKSKFQVIVKIDHYETGKTETIVINDRKT